MMTKEKVEEQVNRQKEYDAYLAKLRREEDDTHIAEYLESLERDIDKMILEVNFIKEGLKKAYAHVNEVEIYEIPNEIYKDLNDTEYFWREIGKGIDRLKDAYKREGFNIFNASYINEKDDIIFTLKLEMEE